MPTVSEGKQPYIVCKNQVKGRPWKRGEEGDLNAGMTVGAAITHGLEEPSQRAACGR